jgi:hypothetical protein
MPLRHRSSVLEDVVRLDLRLDRFAFCERLQQCHLVWLEFQEGEQWVCVSVGGDDELAVVLRTVEAWAVERRLAGIRFTLDGREYVVRGVHALAQSV